MVFSLYFIGCGAYIAVGVRYCLTPTAYGVLMVHFWLDMAILPRYRVSPGLPFL